MGERLSPREETILLGLIQQYIQSREPVASKALAEQNPEKLSPATVRNILTRLERLGFLSQPHTSAGRVPTDEAYRYLAERILEGTSSAQEEPDRSEVDRLMEDGSLNAVASHISNALAQSVHSLGFAVTPPLGEIRLRTCELVPIGADRVLWVVVSQAGQVHQKVLHTPEPYAPEELRWFSAYLSDIYGGWSFSEIRRSLRLQVEGERWECGRQIGQALRLVAPYFLDYQDQRELFWDGAGWLLQAPELKANLDSVRSLLESLRQKSSLLEMLDALAREKEPMRVVIGDDWPDPAVRNLAMVTAVFGGQASGYGVVGIIGPKALSYDSAIPMVRQAARLATLASTRL
jgi:heat-inducible transcriptional repressor